MKIIFCKKERVFATCYIMDELKEPDESQYVVEFGEVVPDFVHLPKEEQKEIAKNVLQINTLQRMECG